MQGVGAAKLEKYGDFFLNVIRDYCAAHEIAEKPKRQWKSPLAKANASGIRRPIAVGEAYNEGKSIQDLMTEFGVKQKTILSNLFNI
jgi:hypothetical protein